MERLHIAFFTNTYLPFVSGVVRSVSEFRQALTDAGHNVFVFAQHDSEYEDQEPFIFRYPSLELPISVDIPAVIPVSPFIDRLLPTLKLDLIHTHHPVVLGQTAANNARKLGLPLVFTFHTQYREYSHYLPLPQAAVQKFVKNLIDDWLVDFMQLCNHIVIPSESMRKILLEDYGLEDRYSVIPTGIDLTAYQKADRESTRAEMGWQDDKVVITVGRLASEKNLPVLFEAVAHAIQSYPEIRLVIIGDGPSRHELEKYAEALGIAARINFWGKISFHEVPRFLKAADLFVFASVSETQGLVTLEAIAAGLPVAAVNATGTSDIVRHGHEGLLTGNNSTALGEAIKTLFAHPDCMENFKMAALKRATTFDIWHQTSRMVDVYHQAIADHKSGQTVRVRPKKQHGTL